MAHEWTRDEAVRHAVEDGANTRMGICDDALMVRLMEVDRDCSVIISRLSSEQRVALMQVLLLNVAAWPVELDMDEKAAMLHGLIASNGSPQTAATPIGEADQASVNEWLDTVEAKL